MGITKFKSKMLCNMCRKYIPAGAEGYWNPNRYQATCMTCDGNMKRNAQTSQTETTIDTTLETSFEEVVESQTYEPLPEIGNALTGTETQASEVLKAIPQPQPFISRRGTLPTDPGTQHIINVSEIVTEDALDSYNVRRDFEINRRIQEELEKALKTFTPAKQEIEHVITIPSLGIIKHKVENPHKLLPELIKVLMSGKVRPWLYGPPGSGKTTLCEQIASAMGLKLITISFAAGSTKSEAVGYNDMRGEYVPTCIYEAVKHGNCILLIDEFDNCGANLATSMNTGIANRLWAFPKEQVKQHETCFIVIATNTNMRGQHPLFPERETMGEATIDRFVCYEIDYNEKEELRWALGEADTKHHATVTAWVKLVQQYRKAARKSRAKFNIGPRASLSGATLINLELYNESSFDSLAERTIFKGIGEGQILTVKAAL